MCNMNTKHHINILMDKLHLVSLNFEQKNLAINFPHLEINLIQFELFVC